MDIDAYKAGEIRYREQQLKDWLGKRTSYHPSELPAGIVPPTNEERSAVEMFEFRRDRPEKYFVYINETTKRATPHGRAKTSAKCSLGPNGATASAERAFRSAGTPSRETFTAGPTSRALATTRE